MKAVKTSRLVVLAKGGAHTHKKQKAKNPRKFQKHKGKGWD
jgi:hypothetical protein